MHAYREDLAVFQKQRFMQLHHEMEGRGESWAQFKALKQSIAEMNEEMRRRNQACASLIAQTRSHRHARALIQHNAFVVCNWNGEVAETETQCASYDTHLYASKLIRAASKYTTVRCMICVYVHRSNLLPIGESCCVFNNIDCFQHQ